MKYFFVTFKFTPQTPSCKFRWYLSQNYPTLSPYLNKLLPGIGETKVHTEYIIAELLIFASVHQTTYCVGCASEDTPSTPTWVKFWKSLWFWRDQKILLALQRLSIRKQFLKHENILQRAGYVPSLLFRNPIRHSTFPYLNVVQICRISQRPGNHWYDFTQAFFPEIQVGFLRHNPTSR